jgi:hypothetical protein
VASLKLDYGKDYRIVLPSTPLKLADGLSISGGRNIVLTGGMIESNDRGLYLKNQTGTVHVEDLAITGQGLKEGIDLDQRLGATVQLRNIRIDTVHGSYESNHADVLQTWAGPMVLRIDGLTASTTYQGFFLLPRQFTPGANIGTWDFRNVNITATAGSGYLLWNDGATNINSTKVRVSKAGGVTTKMLWPGSVAWPGVTMNASTDFVPAGSVGTGYSDVSSADTPGPSAGHERIGTATCVPDPGPTPAQVPSAEPVLSPPATSGTNSVWAAPALNDPQTISVARADSSGRVSLRLDNAKDYRIVLPSTPLKLADGLSISGGRNIVLIGGMIESNDRGLYLKNQTGTVHVEGLAITGQGLKEGIDLDQRLGATVQLVSIRIDIVHGSDETNRADVIQTWGGPRVLRIDGLTASTTDRGLFLLPREFDNVETDTWDFRNINITAAAGSGYLLWSDGTTTIKCTNVFVSSADGATSKTLWPNASTWPGVTVGTASDFVPAGSAGLSYAQA